MLFQRVLLAASTSFVALSSFASERSSYTDMHAHLACLEMVQRHSDTPLDDRCFTSPEMHGSYKFGAYLEALGVSLEELSRKGNMLIVDRLAAKIRGSERVSRAVVLGMDGVIDPKSDQVDRKKTQVYVPNSFVLAAVRRWPDVFLYGPSINPRRQDSLQRLEQAKKDGAVLIKWIPSTMDIDPASPSLTPFYRKLKELDLPLLVHTGKEETFIWAKNELCDPERLLLPLSLGVKVIAAHLATSGENDGVKDYERLRNLFKLKEYKDQLFADISATTQFNRVTTVRELLNDPIFNNRLLYGTDWPLIDAKVMGLSLIPFWLYSTPLYGSFLSLGQASELSGQSNSFDRDVLLKEFLGVPSDVFTRAESVLKLPPLVR